MLMRSLYMNPKPFPEIAIEERCKALDRRGQTGRSPSFSEGTVKGFGIRRKDELVAVAALRNMMRHIN
jgi:hypothetical protein